ncbi:MAG: hypothetical protein IPM35_26415 [Myxococcales bacterium]|nr:hypothetical protein [Myxococcales bacterium]
MPSFVEQVIARLVDEQVEFLVVSGVSAVLQGAPIVTQDLDICYSFRIVEVDGGPP